MVCSFLADFKRTKEFLDDPEFVKNIQKSRKIIMDFFEKHPLITRILDASVRKYDSVSGVYKGPRTYDLLCEMEKVGEERGWIEAAKFGLGKNGYDVEYRVIGKENIPSNKPAIYVANHPYGIVEGLILIGGLGSILKEKGRELKVVGTDTLKMIKGIEERVLFVKISPDKKEGGTFRQNLANLRVIGGYFQGEKRDLALFPAARTSSRKLRDEEWKPSLASLIKYSGQVVPMWFDGPEHGFLYEILVLIKPKWKSLAYLREAWNKKGKEISLRIGHPIFEQELSEKFNEGNGKELAKKKTRYIREICEGLRTKFRN